jgi:hypothetical protein
VRRSSKRIILLALIVAIGVVLAACGGGGTADATVAATVNGEKIMLAEVERVVDQQAQGQQAQLSGFARAQARLQALESLIQREVLFQRAEQEKLLPSDDQVTAAINDQKQQGGLTDEEFARKLKEQNLTPEGLRQEAKKDLAIKSLQEKYSGKITISDREVEEFYNSNKAQFVNARGVALAMIVVDPADNSQQGIQNDAKGDVEAKTKIDEIYQQLKTGDFASIARLKSEDASLLKGGDIGFATEDQLKQNGFPADLIAQFFGSMQVGNYTAPVHFSSPSFPGGRWYIFKLQEKRLQTENLTLESPNVRQQITVELTNERKDILNAALLEVALTEAKVINNLAADLLNNPGNYGLRPASPGAVTPAASSPSASTTPGASPAKPAASPSAKPASSPTKGASPAKQ